MNNYTFKGYRRQNGRVGIRNHVAIIPVDGISNPAAINVAKIIHGAEALTHPFGEVQFGKDLELFFRIMIGVGSNPNVAAAIVIGIEPDWTERITSEIAATGKPVTSFYIERFGDFATIERAARKAKEYIHYASEIKSQEVPLSELVLSIKCSESDTTNGIASNPALGKVVEQLLELGATVMFGETSELTGAEHIIADRFKSEEQQEKFRRIYNDYVGFIENQKANLLGSQPTQGNIRGGLTTIEEKAFGNIQKIGKALIDGVLEPAEAPPGRGLWFMNTSSAAAEALTLFAAGGSVLQIVPTGQGNIVGSPVMPVIKVTANPLTANTMSEHIDVDVSRLLSREISLEQAKNMLMDILLRTCNGRVTSSEVLGHREFLPTKLHRSA